MDDFLKPCNIFSHQCDLVHRLWEIRAYLLYILFMPICCNYTYMVCLMRRPLFQLLYLILLMSFRNVALILVILHFFAFSEFFLRCCIFGC